MYDCFRVVASRSGQLPFYMLGPRELLLDVRPPRQYTRNQAEQNIHDDVCLPIHLPLYIDSVLVCAYMIGS